MHIVERGGVGVPAFVVSFGADRGGGGGADGAGETETVGVGIAAACLVGARFELSGGVAEAAAVGRDAARGGGAGMVAFQPDARSGLQKMVLSLRR